ncbi:MAG TPA: endonuclease/exonuclease/phosphatase family protein [Baekduia sp.]|nr:endonuclease/exonuclease/phosphatase family protein [Baekduia sp.]
MIRRYGLEGTGSIVPMMTFTPYVGLTSPIPLLVALLLRRWAVAAAGLVVVLAFAAALLPRARGDGAAPFARSDTVEANVMAINVYVGKGDPRTVVDLVRRHHVDILAVEELPPAAVKRLDAAGLGRVLRHRQYDPGVGGGSGSGLYSRWPLQGLAPVDTDPVQGEPRGRVQVPGARPLDVQVIHPVPPINDAWRRRWSATFDALPRPDAPGRRGLRVLAGDFNATLDHAALRRLLSGGRGYADAADAVGKGYDTTWPAGRRFPPEITIDHVLVAPEIGVDDLSVHTVPRSDHRAVIATLRVPRDDAGTS